MIFILRWFISYLLIALAMCLDNIFWIPTSPEYPDFLTLGKTKSNILVENKYYFSKLDYILRYRVYSVLTNWRDIVPGLISSFIFSFLW